MTNDEREIILAIKAMGETLAKKCQTLAAMGYIVEFNVNASNGQFENFRVKRTVDVDIAELTAPRKAN